MRINTNVTALNTLRTLGGSSRSYAKSVGRLSSGFRINSASDDAAGLGIANKMRADLRSMRQASRNAEQASSVLQVAEGATQTIASIVDRMKELGTQAASDNVDSAGRARIDAEFSQLRTEIGKIAATTKFQGQTLIDGNFGTGLDTNSANSTALAAGTGVYTAALDGASAGDYTITDGTAAGSVVMTFGASSQTITGLSDGAQSLNFSEFGVTVATTADFTVLTATGGAGSADSTIVQVDAGSNGGSFMVRSSGDYSGDDKVSLTAIDLATDSTGLNLDGLDLTTSANAETALSRLDTAIGIINTGFGTIGAAQNRIEYAMQNTNAAVENISAAESVIRDVDMAEEVTQMTKFQILQQAGTAMLAQANQAPQGVLSLLR